MAVTLWQVLFLVLRCGVQEKVLVVSLCQEVNIVTRYIRNNIGMMAKLTTVRCTNTMGGKTE